MVWLVGMADRDPPPYGDPPGTVRSSDAFLPPFAYTPLPFFFPVLSLFVGFALLFSPREFLVFFFPLRSQRTFSLFLCAYHRRRRARRRG